MKKIIALMCAALFLFGGTYALASTYSEPEPQTFTKNKKKDKGGEKVKASDKKTDNKDSSKDKNTKEGNKKDGSKSDTSKK